MSSSIEFDKIGKLGFGFMRLPRVDGEVDYPHVDKMVDAFLESGGTYFDAAYVYGGAEAALRETLVKRHPRKNFQIATKLPVGMINKDRPPEYFLNESLERLGTDYIDFYLLHGINSGASKLAEDNGAWEYFAKLKKQGTVKHIGFSFHGQPDDIAEILEKHPEAEFIMPQLNYYDWERPRFDAKRIYEITREFNIPVVAMEPLLGGKLASEDSPVTNIFKAANPNVSIASWAMRYLAQKEGIFVVLSGMSNLDQIKDNIGTFTDIKPLSENEEAVINDAIKALRAVPCVDCTYCNYCKDCPANINIPALIGLYNDTLIHKTMTNLSGSYGWMTGGRGVAKDCTSCGACEDICPQNLEIIDTLKKVSELFD